MRSVASLAIGAVAGALLAAASVSVWQEVRSGLDAHGRRQRTERHREGDAVRALLPAALPDYETAADVARGRLMAPAEPPVDVAFADPVDARPADVADRPVAEPVPVVAVGPRTLPLPPVFMVATPLLRPDIANEPEAVLVALAAANAVPSILVERDADRRALSAFLSAAELPERDPLLANVPAPAVLGGQTQGGVLAMLGQPGLRRREGLAEYWQYRAATCVLDVYFYDIGDFPTVAYVEARNRPGGDRPGNRQTSQTRCYEELLASRPAS